MDLIVTYDIDTSTTRGARRLVRVAHTCERYGVRVQDSVFECRLPPARYQQLVEELRGLIDKQTDSVHFYRLGESLEKIRTSLGRGPERTPDRHWIL